MSESQAEVFDRIAREAHGVANSLASGPLREALYLVERLASELAYRERVRD